MLLVPGHLGSGKELPSSAQKKQEALRGAKQKVGALHRKME
jgi:hypothetical protein